MTAKDLNLLTDAAALADWARNNVLNEPSSANQPGQRSRPRADLNAVQDTPAPRSVASRPPPTAMPPTVHRPAPQYGGTARPNTHRHWMLAASIAVMNMLFLVLAGLWLSGANLGVLAPVHEPTPLESPPTSAPALEDVSQQLLTLGQQMDELRGEISQLRARTESTPPANPAQPTSADQPGPADPTPISQAETPPETGAEAKTRLPPVTPASWLVNLGDYASREAARKTQTELAGMGLEAQLRQVSEAGRTVYLVTLDNYSRREDAEKVANKIMRMTQLNGLWVARSPQ